MTSFRLIVLASALSGCGPDPVAEQLDPARVKVGMTEAEVIAVAGDRCQLDEDSTGFVAWLYYKPDCSVLWSDVPADAEEWVFSFKSGKVNAFCHSPYQRYSRSCGADLPR